MKTITISYKQFQLTNRVGKIKLSNYTVNTANELSFSISNISRKVYTAIKNVTKVLYLQIPFQFVIAKKYCILCDFIHMVPMMKRNTQSLVCIKRKTITGRKALHILSILYKLIKLGDKCFRSSANPTIPQYFMLILQPSLLSSSSAIKSSKQNVNKIGHKTEPCQTPLVAPTGSDTTLFHLTRI